MPVNINESFYDNTCQIIRLYGTGALLTPSYQHHIVPLPAFCQVKRSLVRVQHHQFPTSSEL